MSVSTRASVITSLVTSVKPVDTRGTQRFANGALLEAADQAGFDVLITVDQNMPNQQSLRGRSILLLVVHARTTNLDDLLVLLPDALRAIEILKPGEVVQIGTR